jgi:ubiquinone/menaquinone biosynthesis C-methylase UbiE
MNISEKMKQDWNQRALHHARFWIATENYETEEVFAQSGQDTAQALLKAVRGLYRPSWKVLDIGCGIGRVLKPLAKHFHALVGIDVSPTMIAQSKAWLSEISNIATFETSGMGLQEFEDESFNLVYSYVAFQHMPRPVFEQYLGEINRVLTPEGYLAAQLPIGPYSDEPVEDTIGIRSYPIQEITQKLRKNGLDFFNATEVPSPSTNLDQPTNHSFHIIKKTHTIKSAPTVEWAQCEHPQRPAPLDMHLYETYAEDCVKLGRPQEGIQTLQSLVHRHPEHLSGWLRLAAILLETGQVQQAIATVKELTTLHPQYHEGQATFQKLLKKCETQSPAFSTLFFTENQTSDTNQLKSISQDTNKEFSLH